MNTSKAFTVALVAILTFIPAIAFARSERGWTGTGTITNINGSTMFLLGRDNVIHRINVHNSEIILNETGGNCCGLRTGDIVRVHGTVAGPKTINAKRVRILERKAEKQTSQPTDAAVEKRLKIVIDDVPAAKGAEERVSATFKPSEWEARGLITDIDYTARRIKMQTSRGQFTVEIDGALLAAGRTKIGLGRLNLGDSIRVVGNVVGLNHILAREVRVMRTRSEAENALPMKSVSVVGTIQQIDYPSFTFKMQTETVPIVVSADVDTYVQQNNARMSFMNLKPGMRVKMSGYGSVATGFAAQHIQIIGVSP